MKNINLIIDFDSTFVKVETLDVLAHISSNNTNKNKIIHEISSITDDAMNGKIGFHEALKRRIDILKIKRNNIIQANAFIQKKISDSFVENKLFLNKNADNCYIVSGGFKEIIEPIVCPLGIKKENIYANTFKIEKDIIINVDQNNPLAHDKGKVEILKKFININNKKSIILGDGYTDYELKKYNEAKYFVQFIENINRKMLNEKADFIASNFNQVIKYIKQQDE